MAEIGKIIVRVGADASEFTKGMDRISQDLAKTQRDFNRWTDGLRAGAAKLKDAGMALSTAITLPLAGLAAAAIKVRSDFDSLERGMTAVTGSAAKAQAEMERLKETAKLPGLGFREAVQGSINLQAAGFAAGQARNTLEAFGNALATVGKGKADLDGVVLALGQIQAKGKVSAEEINQIAERVPQIRQAMKAAFGTADTEVLQKMGISAEQFVAKITTELNKLPKATGGLKNSWENLRDSWDQALNEMGKTLEPFAAKAATALEGLAEQARDLAKAYKELAPWQQNITNWLVGLAAGIPVAILVFGTLAEKMLALGAAAKTIAPMLKGVAIGVAGVAAAIASAPAAAIIGGVAGIYGASQLDKHLSRAQAAENWRQQDVTAAMRQRTSDSMWQIAAQHQKAAIAAQNHAAAVRNNADAHKTLGGAVERLTAAQVFSDEVGKRLRSTQEQLVKIGYDILVGARDQKVSLAELVPQTIAWSDAIRNLPMHSVRNLLEYLNPAWLNLNSSIERSKALIESLKPAALRLKEAFENLGLKTPSDFASKKAQADQALKTIEAAQKAGDRSITPEVVEAAKRKVEELGRYGGTATLSKWAQDVKQTISTVYNDFNKSLADIVVSGGKFGDMMKKSFETAEKALLRLAFSEGFKALGKQLANMMKDWKGLTGVLSKIPGLKSIGGSAAGAATSAATTAAQTASSGLGAATSTATSMLSGVVSGAISAVGSIISGFMVKSAINGLKSVTEQSNAILTHMVDRNNTFLPALIGIHERLIEIRQLGIRVWTDQDTPLHVQSVGALAAGGGLTVEINNSSFIGFRDMDAFIDEIVRRIRQRL